MSVPDDDQAGGLLGQGVLREHDPERWPNTYVGVIEIGGYRYQVTAAAEWERGQRKLIVRVRNVPASRPRG